MRTSGTACRGFTLLEVMVAIAILAIALTSLIGSQNQALFVATEADFSFQSSLLARQKLSEILSSTDNSFETSGDFGENYPGFYWKAELSDPDFTDAELLEQSAPFLRRLELTVHTEDERRTFTIVRYFLVENNR